MHLEKVDNSFAGRVLGFDINGGASAADLAQIERYLAECPVLCFPDQPLTDDAQSAFVHALGPPALANHDEVVSVKNHDPRLIDVSNVEADGSPIEKGSARAKFLDANLLWHTDGSFLSQPMRVTGLSARSLPAFPPPTEYADMRAAYDALTPEMKRTCEDLVVEHSLYNSRRKMGMEAHEFSAEAQARFPAVRHRLVRTHAVSGRKSLYLASHAGQIVGWPDEEAHAFIDELTAFATQPRFLYVHHWRACDFVMWDDSATMHRATPYDLPEPRKMRWTGAMEREVLAV